MPKRAWSRPLQICARRRADRPGVALREAHPLLRKPVEARRFVERVPTAAGVIGENEDEVGALPVRCRHHRKRSQQQGEENRQGVSFHAFCFFQINE